MIFITLFNFLIIKILGSTKKNVEVEKNLELNTSRQKPLIQKQENERL
jgi:hypothetical protein